VAICPGNQIVSDEVQRVIDEQGDVLEPTNNSDPVRCDNCSKSEIELPIEVTLKRCNACGMAVYCVGHPNARFSRAELKVFLGQRMPAGGLGDAQIILQTTQQDSEGSRVEESRPFQ
jgi:hypothetical protein